MNYGCIRFVDSYRFLSSGLDSLVKTIVDNINKTLKNLKEEYVDNDHMFNTVTDLGENNRTIEDKYLTEKLAYPFEYFNSIDEY